MNIKFKNLIVIHLESVNMDCFYRYKEKFKFINSIKEKGVYFTNYYSSATSTYMVISDLFYGEPVFESANKLTDIYNSHPKKSSLFDDLENKGYETLLFFIGNISVGEYKGVFSSLSISKKLYYNFDEKSVLDTFNKSCEEKKKFAFFFEYDQSHVAYVNSYEQQEFANRNAARYGSVDNFVKKVFNILRDTERLTDTIVVMYGDHGDDFFSHGLHNGYTHAIEPYNFLVHCPLMFFGLDNKLNVNTMLLNTFDICTIIKNELQIDKNNLANKAVVSRNLFSNQKKEKLTFNKSYAITNGRYCLISTNDGLQLYNNTIDYYNHFNLLDLFCLSKKRIWYNKKYRYMRGTHYHYLIDDKSIKEIKDNYLFLLRELDVALKKMGISWEIEYKSEGVLDKIKREAKFKLLLSFKNIIHVIKRMIKVALISNDCFY